MTQLTIQDIYPLSPMQQGMLFHTLYAAESGVYCEQTVLTLSGRLQVDMFRRAWQHLQRHALLRTAFLWEEVDAPMQVVFQEVDLPITAVDWRHISAETQSLKLETWLAEDRRRGFDLAQPPLMRLHLIQTADNIHQVVWSFHHLLLDGWSVPQLLQEVFTSYDALYQGQQPTHIARRPYRDYIAWLQQQDLTAAETYWRQALTGFSTPTPFNVDRQSDLAQDAIATHNQQQLELSISETAALQTWVRQQALTLNSLMQGAWSLLLSHYSGEQDVLFGATVSGRPSALANVEQMIGLFINTLPVRVKIPQQGKVSDWLLTLQNQQLEARQYEYTPLTDVQTWSEVPGDLPLFGSILIFENYPYDDSLVQNLSQNLTLVDAHSVEISSYPLNFVVIPGQRLTLRLHYDESRFSQATISRMLSHLHRLLHSMTQQPDATLAQVGLLTDSEQEQLLNGWGQAKTAYPDQANVLTLFAAQVEERGAETAVTFHNITLTYRQLNERANQVAHFLIQKGVKSGDLVGLAMERSADLVVGMLAILKAGAAYVPLDPTYPQERLLFMLADTEAAVLLTQSHLTETFRKLPLPTIIAIDTDWQHIQQMALCNPAPTASADSVVYVMYTSGSTGQPKGITIPHRAIIRLLFNSNYITLTAQDIIAQASNASFDAATFEIWGALLHGAQLVCIPQDVALSAHAFADTLRTAKISVLFITTALFNQIAAELPTAFASLHCLLFGGQLVDPRWVKVIQETAPPQRLLHVYGPTESTTFATWHLVEAVSAETATVPIGQPLANSTLYVLDSQLQPVPVGVPGELYIGGDGLAHGYFKRPSLTAACFIPNPFQEGRLYKTGDLVRYRQDGHVEFIGRIDNQVKIRGFRIELGEIEAALGQHPAIGEMIVVAHEESPGNKYLLAYIVSQADTPPTTDTLRHFLSGKLPNYMIPAVFIFLESLPLNPNGKVDHRALPLPGQLRPNLIQGFVSPQTAVEEILAEIWVGVLNIEQVGIHDNFFDLGGHSLKATQIASSLRQRLEIRLPLRAIFEQPTIHALAEVVEDILLDEIETISEEEAVHLLTA